MHFPVFFDKKEENGSNSLITKARLTLFYKGLNRNGSIINDAVADELIDSIDYCPIKGSYNLVKEDFGSHSLTKMEKAEEKIYGVIPKEHNFSWEEKEDKDGVVRTYACVDAFLWTGVMDEANKIIGNSQSMELYPPSVEGEWIIHEGKKVFQFKNAKFLGLQVLGKDVEPCFEGSMFFSLLEKIQSEEDNKVDSEQQLINLLEQYNLQLEEEMGKNQNKQVPEGTSKDLSNFKLSANAIRQEVDSILSASEKYRYVTIEVCKDFVVYVDFNLEKYYKRSFTIDEATDKITLAENAEEVYLQYLTQEEKEKYNAMQTESKAAIENYSAALEKITSLEEEVSNFKKKDKKEDKVDEKKDKTNEGEEEKPKEEKSKEEEKPKEEKVDAEENKTDEKQEEKVEESKEENEEKPKEDEDSKKKKKKSQSNFEIENKELLEKNATLQSEIEVLTAFKNNILKAEKEEAILKYDSKLAEEVLNEIKGNIDNYTLEELEKELAYQWVMSNPEGPISNSSSTIFNRVRIDDNINNNSELNSLLEQVKNKMDCLPF